MQLQLVNAKTIVIGSFYRPPNDSLDSIEQLRISLSRSQIWFGGDFNCGSIDWKTLSKNTYSTHSKVCDKLIETSVENNLDQIVEETTRIESQSLLELFFTNNPTLVDKVLVIQGISDHEIPMIDVNVRPLRNKQIPRKIFLYHKADIDKLKEEAATFSRKFLESDHSDRNVEDMWQNFKSELGQN